MPPTGYRRLDGNTADRQPSASYRRSFQGRPRRRHGGSAERREWNRNLVPSGTCSKVPERFQIGFQSGSFSGSKSGSTELELLLDASELTEKTGF